MQTLEQASPVAPTGADSVEQSSKCTNCGVLAPGEFCPGCGQGRSQRLTIPRVFAHAARKLFRLDFNLVRTFVGLLRRPGELIRQYVAGQRAPYTNPLGYALLNLTLFVAVDSLLSSPVARMFDPVLWFGPLSPYLGFVLVVPAAVLLRWQFRKRDLTHAEAYTFVLYVGSQIVLLETLVFALTTWTQVSWPRIPALLLEAGFTAWALTRFLDDRRPSVWLRGLLTFGLMAAGVVAPLYLLARNVWSAIWR